MNIIRLFPGILENCFPSAMFSFRSCSKECMDVADKFFVSKLKRFVLTPEFQEPMNSVRRSLGHIIGFRAKDEEVKFWLEAGGYITDIAYGLGLSGRNADLPSIYVYPYLSERTKHIPLNTFDVLRRMLSEGHKQYRLIPFPIVWNYILGATVAGIVYHNFFMEPFDHIESRIAECVFRGVIKNGTIEALNSYLENVYNYTKSSFAEELNKRLRPDLARIFWLCHLKDSGKYCSYAGDRASFEFKDIYTTTTSISRDGSLELIQSLIDYMSAKGKLTGQWLSDMLESIFAYFRYDILEFFPVMPRDMKRLKKYGKGSGDPAINRWLGN